MLRINRFARAPTNGLRLVPMEGKRQLRTSLEARPYLSYSPIARSAANAPLAMSTPSVLPSLTGAYPPSDRPAM